MHKNSPKTPVFISISFDKFYFITGFFTLSLSFAFSLEIFMAFVISMKQLYQIGLRALDISIMGKWRYRPMGC